MKLQPTSRRPCELERGQARRVPQNTRSGLVGYHVCCLRCGFVTVALHGHEGFVIRENDDRTEISFSAPVRCLFCKVLIHVSNSEITLEEDEHVRVVRYR